MIRWIRQLFESRTFGVARSSKWPQVRKQWLIDNPECAICGTKGSVLLPNEVHHCIPVHIDKTLELEKSNFLTACRIHHFWYFHLGSWFSYNFSAKEDAKIWRDKIKGRP